jgi:hypothetical protein
MKAYKYHKNLTNNDLLQFCFRKKYILFVLITVQSVFSTFSQPIIGKYTGLHSDGYTFKYTKKGKKIITKEYFIEKSLELFADSIFILSFRKFNIHSSIGNEIRYCTGNWKTHMDTLILFSTYRMQDFCQVDEQFIPTCENELNKIVIIQGSDSITPCNRVRVISAEVVVDSKSMGQCNSNDTLFFKSKPISTIDLTSVSGRFMRWKYQPKFIKSNFFTFYIKTCVKDENICLENGQLLIKDGKLIPLEIFDDLYVDRYPYKIQR